MMPRLDLVTLMQADGCFTKDEVLQALDMAKKAITTLYEKQKRALKERYSKLVQEVESEEVIE